MSHKTNHISDIQLIGIPISGTGTVEVLSRDYSRRRVGLQNKGSGHYELGTGCLAQICYGVVGRVVSDKHDARLLNCTRMSKEP